MGEMDVKGHYCPKCKVYWTHLHCSIDLVEYHGGPGSCYLHYYNKLPPEGFELLDEFVTFVYIQRAKRRCDG